jgi:hypothetical protein
MPDISAPDAGPGAGGPSSSVPFGQAGAVNQLAQQTRQAGPPPGGVPSGPPPGSAPGGLPPPAQPPPQQPTMPSGQQRVTPLSPMRGQPPQPWREQLRVWADHPLAGPSLRALARLANLDQNGSNSKPAGQ